MRIIYGKSPNVFVQSCPVLDSLVKPEGWAVIRHFWLHQSLTAWGLQRHQRRGYLPNFTDKSGHAEAPCFWLSLLISEFMHYESTRAQGRIQGDRSGCIPPPAQTVYAYSTQTAHWSCVAQCKVKVVRFAESWLNSLLYTEWSIVRVTFLYN